MKNKVRRVTLIVTAFVVVMSVLFVGCGAKSEEEQVKDYVLKAEKKMEELKELDTDVLNKSLELSLSNKNPNNWPPLEKAIDKYIKSANEFKKLKAPGSVEQIHNNFSIDYLSSAIELKELQRTVHEPTSTIEEMTSADTVREVVASRLYAPREEYKTKLQELKAQ